MMVTRVEGAAAGSVSLMGCGSANVGSRCGPFDSIVRELEEQSLRTRAEPSSQQQHLHIRGPEFESQVVKPG